MTTDVLQQAHLLPRNAKVSLFRDAERILGLSAKGAADGGRSAIESGHRGSIEDPTARTFSEEILEGGEQVFERRRRKQGFRS